MSEADELKALLEGASVSDSTHRLALSRLREEKARTKALSEELLLAKKTLETLQAIKEPVSIVKIKAPKKKGGRDRAIPS